ncbi:hypothetical protein MRI28_21085 [Nocardiopsis dassonvillei]|uniref:hypothetical protein n=1 Tax=Nocardiopsis dassonvillei TaxID=2014 RepID=UPI00200EB8E4|nr:hypothetical protein [Nocardiopsis dassonvillei]MCK9872103.1 hypothetical protein [Nocardiopsis dassonvillei]
MTRHEGHTPVFLALSLSACLALAACSTPEPEPEEAPPADGVSRFWVEREAMMLTLDRMLTENGPEEVVADIGGSRDRLLDSGVLQQTEDGYAVELDKDTWRTEGVDGTARIDDALIDAMEANEVTWCGGPVNGDEFVDAYMEEHWETLDSQEEYTASVADYVDCGDGTP